MAQGPFARGSAFLSPGSSFDLGGIISGGLAGGLTGGLSNLIGGAVGGLFGGGGGGLTGDDILHFQMAQDDRAYYRNLATIRNTPAAQVQGLRAAGLNPILAATQFNAGSGRPPQGSTPSVPDTKSQRTEAQARIKLANATSAKTLSETRLLEAKTRETLASEDLKKGQKGRIVHEIDEIKAHANQMKDLSAKHQQDVQESIRRMNKIEQDRLVQKVNEAIRKEDLRVVRVHLERLKQDKKIFESDYGLLMRVFQNLFGTANINVSARN